MTTMGVFHLLLTLLVAGGWCAEPAAGVVNSTRPGGAACSGGVIMHDLTGTLPSPRVFRSNKYPDNMYCSWRIEVPEDRRVRIQSSSLFNIEETDGCRFDYLHVYDGEDATGTLLANLCGTRFPASGINSSTNVMYIVFKSDNSIGKSGFQLHYTNIPMEFPGLAVPSVSVPAEATPCRKRLTDATGSFASPGFGTSKTYIKNAKCQWVIQASLAKVVKLEFTTFDLEYSSKCLYDYVSVYDGPSTNAPLIDTYCGSHLPPAFRSSGRHVTIVFHSDSLVQRAGFQASYSTEPKPADHPAVPGCYAGSRPAVLTGMEGHIISPGQGPKGNYPDKTICQWKVVVPANKRAHLHFSEFALEPDVSCKFDHLQVFDGDDVSAPNLGRYCGADTPGDITATGNTLLVQFRSDDSVTAAGFSAVYSAKHALGGDSSNGEPACGLPHFQPKFSRVVGGTEAAPHTWPWQVSLQGSRGHICGATIIAKRWIITAAHCLFTRSGYMKDTQDLRVVVGEHNLHVSEGREQKINISQAIVHKKYNKKTKENDIALLQLTSDIRYTTAVLPVCLPRRDAPTEMICVTTGWGDTQGTGNPKMLNQVRVPIIARSTCRRPDWYYKQFTDTMVCAGYSEGGKDSCQGDSGGPLVCLDADTYHLQGITSWGFGCARPRAPGVYTRVVHFTDWIERQTNGAPQAPP